jgi:hypothetical protein
MQPASPLLSVEAKGNKLEMEGTGMHQDLTYPDR